jgi:hypothetical protein
MNFWKVKIGPYFHKSFLSGFFFQNIFTKISIYLFIIYYFS